VPGDTTQAYDKAAVTGTFAVRPGEVIAERYVVEEVLRSGGMGLIVRARHRALGQTVAIKFIRESLASDAEVFARFSREARTVASIQSDKVVRMLDFGVLPQGLPYMVMEYLSGQDLKCELTRRATLPIEEAVDYAIQAADGLAAAHARGVIHRDIKLANLFLVEHSKTQRSIKVVDFGVSKLDRPADDLELTGTAVSLGSPTYMSPEQIRSARNVDLRTDIWSLGVVLYKMLTGAFPFSGNDVGAISAAIAADAPVAPRQLRPEIPAELEAVVLRCLEKKKEARFDSTASLARALAPFASETCRLAAQHVTTCTPDDSPATREPERDGSSTTAATAMETHVDIVMDTAAGSVMDSQSSARRTSRRALAAVGLLALVLVAGAGALALRASSVARVIKADPPVAPASEPPVSVAAETSTPVTTAPSAAAKPAPTTSKADTKRVESPKRRKPAVKRAGSTELPARPDAPSSPRFGGSALDE
jgi:serine/threonine-protein kinase